MGKVCVECGRDKTRDGLYCSACYRRHLKSTPRGKALLTAIDARYRSSRKGQAAAERAQQRYRSSEKFRSTTSRYLAGYRRLPLVKARVRAMNGVHRAVQKGTLTKVPCWCGEAKVQAHHPRGYEPPADLIVEWLCARHHRERHPRPSERTTSATSSGTSRPRSGAVVRTSDMMKARAHPVIPELEI